MITWTNLLHVSKNVLTAVENSFALLRVQVEDEVSGVVGITVFIPIVEHRQTIILLSGRTGSHELIIYTQDLPTRIIYVYHNFISHVLSFLYIFCVVVLSQKVMLLTKFWPNISLLLFVFVAVCISAHIHALLNHTWQKPTWVSNLSWLLSSSSPQDASHSSIEQIHKPHTHITSLINLQKTLK